MAVIKSPTLFFITSPRSPAKMRPEIELLAREFGGEKWNGNKDLQTRFMQRLAQLPEFEGAASQSDPALSARDRITRGPKALGLVSLQKIALTPAGRNFCDTDLFEEALLRQLLKFQLPSPFHKTNQTIGRSFWVRPYLEILRLIHILGRLSFDELCLYGMQLTDYREFDSIVSAVRVFRMEKERRRGRYRAFLHQARRETIERLFADEIAAGKIKTRESATIGLDKFVKTKASNLRDYGDACLRYLRATGLVTITNPGRTISIIESRREDVAYILNTVNRDPVFVQDEAAYCEHLFNEASPVLLTDDRDALNARAVQVHAVETEQDAAAADAFELKKRIRRELAACRKSIIQAQLTELKSFDKYEDVLDAFSFIRKKEIYDPPLALEWNVWRAMAMMDGGNVTANLHFDDAGNPLSTASGNVADIVCDYGDFVVSVEVTLQSGSRQYDAEGEPVARHLGDLKTKTKKEAYCLFLAPKVSDSVISHFYVLHKTNVRHYGGKSVIVPLSIDRFKDMLAQAKSSGCVPAPDKIRAFFEYSKKAADAAEDETDWHQKVSEKAGHWLE